MCGTFSRRYLLLCVLYFEVPALEDWISMYVMLPLSMSMWYILVYIYLYMYVCWMPVLG